MRLTFSSRMAVSTISFELLSYTTGNKSYSGLGSVLTPASELPPSETQGVGILDVQGHCFGNLPPSPQGYIHRESLEKEVSDVLLATERYPIITLVGRGGIGKTSLALHVLHGIAESGQFAAIVWLSARDIDLLPDGPKVVKPHVLSERDIADESAQLLGPRNAKEKGFKSVTYLSQSLQKSPLENPFLFVFDNFETVQNPAELFAWIDTFIRLPNKVLITSRFRDFKADYPVEVLGMTEHECEKLIDITAADLKVTALLTEEYRRDCTWSLMGIPM